VILFAIVFIHIELRKRLTLCLSLLVCNEGKHPRVARFPTRGDWILVKGPLFNETSSDKMVPNTIYPYKKYLQEGDEKYECVSDHAIITVDIPLTK
jgi:hypothetical protein